MLNETLIYVKDFVYYMPHTSSSQASWSVELSFHSVVYTLFLCRCLSHVINVVVRPVSGT